ncbi:MAG: NADH-quinone oxidoreductase subunit H [Planctomycetes bacterium]|nr:NADH-quinone oxidoreductase subunit H [Planctomycetota bacterium]
MLPQFIVSVITILVVIHVILLSCSYLIFLERKVAAWTQDRIGPNRTNFSFGLLPFKGKHFGLGQALADGIKLFFKEDYTPPQVDRVLFILAPIIVVIPALLSWAVIPWGGYYLFDQAFTVPAWLPLLGGVVVSPTIVNVTAAPINIGVVYILAIGSTAVYGVVVGGYASNNKYSFLGGLRATAQMLSYEIPMALCVLVVILTSHGALGADQFVHQQANGVWNIFYQPLLAIIFFACVLAECNRAPFDLAEAEQELVGGYHTEYSSMKWALFFLGEYIHMITGAGFFTLLFLGGWDLPIIQEPLIGGLGLVLLKFIVFASKILVLLFVMMWIRWTLPRFRFDQLMRLAWRALIPLALLILLASGFLVFKQHAKWFSPWLYTAVNIGAIVLAAVIGPFLPQGPPMNRKVGLAGSRFSPVV